MTLLAHVCDKDHWVEVFTPVEKSVQKAGDTKLGFKNYNPAAALRPDSHPEYVKSVHEWLESNKHTMTGAYPEIALPVDEAIKVPGSVGEHLRINHENVQRIAQSIKQKGFDRHQLPLMAVEHDGTHHWLEGNHRIRAAKEAGLSHVPVEVRYYGGSEMKAGVYDPLHHGAKLVDEVNIGPNIQKADIPMSVKAIVHDDSGRVLVLKDHYSEYWDFPGGHMDSEEEPLEALKRELQEEIGLETEHPQEYDLSGNIKIGQDNHPVLFYTVKAHGTPELSEEHDKYKWVSSRDVEKLNLGAFKGILKKWLLENTPKKSIPRVEDESIYELLDEMLHKPDEEHIEKAGMDFGRKQPYGAKSIGTGIEQRLFQSLSRDVNSYLSSLHGQESREQVLHNFRRILDRWAVDQIPAAQKAFEELFKRGFRVGAVDAGFSGKMGTEDTNALKMLEQSVYRIGERIRLFSDDVVQEFSKLIQQAYTREGVFSLEHLVQEMRKVVPAERFKLERIARTEVSITTNTGRLWAWSQDPEKYRYQYRWNSTPDARRREMKKIRSEGNPYDWDGIKFLWMHNHQHLPDGTWEMGAINCRCSLTRYPTEGGVEFKQPNRFAGKENDYRKTLDLDIP